MDVEQGFLYDESLPSHINYNLYRTSLSGIDDLVPEHLPEQLKRRIDAIFAALARLMLLSYGDNK